MKLKKILAYYGAVVMFSSCGLDVMQRPVYEKIEHLPMSTLSIEKVSNLPCMNIVTGFSHNFLEEEAESVEFVQLETSRKSLMTFPKDFMCVDDCYAVLDQQTEALLLFDQNGKFLRQIGNKGQGPKEYAQLKCFTYQDGKFFLYDSYCDDLLIFGLDGSFISKSHVDNPGFVCSIIPMGNSLLLSSSSPYPRTPLYRVVSISSNGDVKERIFPTEYTYPAPSEFISIAANGRCLINPSHSDTVFCISEKSIKPICTLGYYKGNESREIRDYYCSLGPNVFSQYINSEEDKSLMSFRIHDMEGCMVFEYNTCPRVGYISVIDKRDNTCRNYQRYNRNKGEQELPFHLFYTDNRDHLVAFCLDKDWIKSHEYFYGLLSSDQKNLLDSHQDDDNPLIVRIKIKNRS